MALLYEAGTLGVEVRPGVPGEVVLLAYFTTGSAPDLAEVLSLVPGARVEPSPVPEVDWAARSRETFRAFTAGRFRIVPAWEAPVAGPEVIVVDPGRAFGTGTHETTRLCLSAIEELAGERPLGCVLDLGTGTGLLAVAARRLGARVVVAVDIDPDAIGSARLHARLNAVDLAVVRADGGGAFRARAFDLVIANLSAPLLRQRAGEITALAGPEGALVLSGLLAEDVADIAAAYAPLRPLETRMDGEWACLRGRRR
jgi:ribosomal protein L11 methyltransferase